MTKFVTEPGVYLVSKPSVDWEMLSRFLADEELPDISESIKSGRNDALAIAETSARLCYMSFGRGRTDINAFIENLMRHKDGSVFEHINYGFVLTGISRSLTHEFVRHRAGFAYSQRSQRYVDEADCKFVIPPDILDNVEDGSAVMDALNSSNKQAMADYKLMVEVLDENIKGNFPRKTEKRKAVRQAARSVLPNNTETKLFATGNVRAWRHFLEMRCSQFADAEIRRLALIILDILREEAPVFFGDFVVVDTDSPVWAYPEHSKI